MIRIRNLTKVFGDRRAVDGLDLDIASGETFGLLGPNGAGKTTSIHCLVGVTPPDAGEITIGDGGSPSTPAVRERIGIAPQRLALYPELTGEENVRFFGELYGLHGKELKARVDDALDFVGLADRRGDAVDKYSGGMQRRINLACAIVHDPDIVVLDEPTVGVDPQSRNHVFENIEALHARGKTILYTTHYMEEAARLCDRVAIMDGGKLLALDTVDGLIDELGGRSTVRLEVDGDVPAAAALPADVVDGELRFDADEPMTEIAALTNAGVSFRSLHVQRPDLEAVFLNLTGRSLRD